jgi:hypothetical protein
MGGGREGERRSLDPGVCRRYRPWRLAHPFMLFLRPLFRQSLIHRNATRNMGVGSLARRPAQLPGKMEILLSETEDQLCTLLDEGAKWMEETKGLKTSCRIAGGWVRDKVCVLKGCPFRLVY